MKTVCPLADGGIPSTDPRLANWWNRWTVYMLDSASELRELLASNKAGELNWLFSGTDGIHGSCETAAGLLATGDWSEGVTILVVMPRIVRIYGGHLRCVTKEDLEWIAAREAETVSYLAGHAPEWDNDAKKRT